MPTPSSAVFECGTTRPRRSIGRAKRKDRISRGNGAHELEALTYEPALPHTGNVSIGSRLCLRPFIPQQQTSSDRTEGGRRLLAGSAFAFRLHGSGWGFVHPDISLAGPSKGVPNVALTIHAADSGSASPEIVFYISDAFGLRSQVCRKTVARLPCDITKSPMLRYSAKRPQSIAPAFGRKNV
jgi:hypothetical protein